MNEIVAELLVPTAPPSSQQDSAASGGSDSYASSPDVLAGIAAKGLTSLVGQAVQFGPGFAVVTHKAQSPLIRRLLSACHAELALYSPWMLGSCFRLAADAVTVALVPIRKQLTVNMPLSQLSEDDIRRFRSRKYRETSQDIAIPLDNFRVMFPERYREHMLPAVMEYATQVLPGTFSAQLDLGSRGGLG